MTASRPRCSTALNLAVRSMRSRRMAVIFCSVKIPAASGGALEGRSLLCWGNLSPKPPNKDAIPPHRKQWGILASFRELALAVCTRESLDQRFNHLDTTSFSLSGNYVPESDAQAITITHGYSKDHRPDLKQAVLELLVSQDGGVPFVSKSWDGNASDTKIFQERAEALIATFKHAPTPRYVVADAKLYNEDNATHLNNLGFITRIRSEERR